MKNFICCDKLAGVEMIEVGDDMSMWVYACKVCKKHWCKDIYDRDGEKIEASKAHLRKVIK